MKYTITYLIALLFTGVLYGQTIDVLPIDSCQFNTQSSKIILLSADWCGICRSNKKMIESSEQIAMATGPNIKFYELKENYQQAISLGDSVYHYRPTSSTDGEHEFVHFLSNSESTPVYPTFVVLDPQNHVLATFSGYLTEAELLLILSQLPDSNNS